MKCSANYLCSHGNVRHSEGAQISHRAVELGLNNKPRDLEDYVLSSVLRGDEILTQTYKKLIYLK